MLAGTDFLRFVRRVTIRKSGREVGTTVVPPMPRCRSSLWRDDPPHERAVRHRNRRIAAMRLNSSRQPEHSNIDVLTALGMLLIAFVLAYSAVAAAVAPYLR